MKSSKDKTPSSQVVRLKGPRARRLLLAIDDLTKISRRMDVISDANTGRTSAAPDAAIGQILINWHRAKYPRKIDFFTGKPSGRGKHFSDFDIQIPSEINDLIVEAVLTGNVRLITEVGLALKRVKRRCTGKGETFKITPAKPDKLVAISKAEEGSASAEDITQAVWAHTKRRLSERQARRIAADLGHPPASKGGYKARRP